MFNTILNWSIAAILASFTIMPGSFTRQTAPAAEPITEEAELKGCAIKHFDDLIQFKYTGLDYSEEEVQDTDNWTYHGINPSGCEDIDQRACVIWVSEEFVNPEIPASGSNPAIPPTLKKEDLVLATSIYVQDETAYVTGSNDTFMEISNDENP